MKRRSLALILLAIPFMAAPAWPDEVELLTPGPALERPIAVGETHVFRVEASDTPLFVVVEQRGIDLIVEVSGLPEQKVLRVDSLNDRWGAEVFLVSPGSTGETRIAVRPGVNDVPPGRYTIQVDVTGTGETEQQKVAAWAAMSRAAQLSPATPEARQQALAAYREALEAWRTLGERRWEAETLRLIASWERWSGNLSAAAKEYDRAAALWRDLSEPRREADVLRFLGVIRLGTGEIEAAREATERSIALWQSIGERAEEVRPRNELCLLELKSGSLLAARTCFEEARALFQDLGDGSQEANMLNSLGGVYDLLGEPDAALDHYEQALDKRRRLGDRRGEVETLNNIAEVHRALGEWQEALRIFAEAREILEPLEDQALKGVLLNNMGYTYMALGEWQRARPLLQDALTLRRQTGARWEELITLNNLGSVWRRLGDPEKARDYHGQALKMALTQKDSRQEALSRLSLTGIELEKGTASDESRREIASALTYFRENDIRRGELMALQLQGRALALSSQPGEALPVIKEVLARNQALRDRAGEAEALRALATVERSLGLLAEARTHAGAAVARVEDLRTSFVSPDLRVAFLATQRRAYSLLIDLLMARHGADPGGGYDLAAFEISEQARARSLLDALYSGTAQRPGTAVPAKLTERRRSLRRRLSAMADQQLNQSGERAEALARDIETLLVELDSVEIGIRSADPQYAAFSKPQPISVQRITGLLDPGTVLLEYSLGEERSFLWVIGGGGLRSFVLPPQREIEDLARRAYEELRTVESGLDRRPDAAEDMSRKVLGPAWSEIAGARRLIIVPDGALHLLPFGALPVPGPGQTWDTPGWKPLLEYQEVVYVPSATTLALQRERLERRPPATKFAAVLADPVFAAQDPRLTSAVNRQPSSAETLTRGEESRGLFPVFERLPSSEREAEAIRRLADPGKVRTALGLEASREAVLSGEFQPYQVVHFATHGIADARNPELSGLVLSLVDANGRPQEGFLGLSDVYELDLAADLVVLSGCQTALGKEVSGEGIMGLTRGFLYAGVPRVVASLWKVQDRTTAELMTRFYRAMWKDRKSPAAALREAQQSLRREPRYRDPYFWAGFVLQGDWR